MLCTASSLFLWFCITTPISLYFGWHYIPTSRLNRWNLLQTSYTPLQTTCPSQTLIRDATSKELCREEAMYVERRQSHVQTSLSKWLSNSHLEGINIDKFVANGVPKVALAFSGGGYRAMLTGAGQLAALDNRTRHANEPGHLGGLLQATTYISGLSGGNWLVTSVITNHWASVEELQASSTLWELKYNMLDPTGWNFVGLYKYWKKIIVEVSGKKLAGFSVSITDFYGRGLSHQLYGVGTDHAEGTTWSGVAEYNEFKRHEMPFPIVVANGRAPNTVIVNSNSTVFELSPFELGSWDPTLAAFMKTKYIGSSIEGGETIGPCYVGYDNVGFVTGTSATLFNAIYYTVVEKLPKFIASPLLNLYEHFSWRNKDIAPYDPNPFYKFNNSINHITRSAKLNLVDGGEDEQNVPLYPFLQPQRGVDVIFAFDNSADTKLGSPNGVHYPDGSSLIAAYERQFSSQGTVRAPKVPDKATFVYGGYVEQPTFFGCEDPSTPLVVYIANSRHSYDSGQPTFKINYDDEERDAMIRNGYNIATQNNGTLDENWRACVACAVILRQQQKLGESPTGQCARCFESYCWNGGNVTASTGKGGRRDGKSNVVSNII